MVGFCNPGATGNPIEGTPPTSVELIVLFPASLKQLPKYFKKEWH